MAFSVRTVTSFFTILRPVNAVMAGCAVGLGFWLSHAASTGISLGMLIGAAVAATGFGNVVNDIIDVESDTVNHPQRPLPSHTMSKTVARLYAGLLAVIALVCGFLVSPVHGSAVVIPCVFLLVYAVYLKGTPLAGNVLVSLLVAYPLLFGALTAGYFRRLPVPALLAFLLNCAREIVKDVHDEQGDRKLGVHTTAVLGHSRIRILLIMLALCSFLLIEVPFFLGHFGKSYALLCAVLVIPLHGWWFFRISTTPFSRTMLFRTATLIKVEMVCGLAACAVDELVSF